MTPATLRALGEPPSSVAYLLAHPEHIPAVADGHVPSNAPEMARPINPPSDEDGS